MIRYDAIVVAYGQGSRTELGYNKAFYRLKDGQTVLEHSLKPFREDDDCQKVIVITSDDRFAEIDADPKIILKEGGKLRQDSVYNGLKEVKAPYVLIHDAARPFMALESLKALKEALKDEDAAILAVMAKDTIKEVKDGYIVQTLDRNKIYLAQTPQGAKSELLKRLFDQAYQEGRYYTDEASMLEASGIKVKVVTGTYANSKITYKEDLESL